MFRAPSPGNLTAIAVAIILTGCAAPSTTDKGKNPYDVQVLQAGDATCIATSTSASQVGAAATSAARAKAGLPPVRSNPLLDRAAAEHACDMAQRGRMTHVGSRTNGPGARVKALGYRTALTAENIAAGPYDLNRVLQEWNSSPGHLANILIPRIRDFGIGQAVAADGKTRFWAAVYGAPR